MRSPQELSLSCVGKPQLSHIFSQILSLLSISVWSLNRLHWVELQQSSQAKPLRRHDILLHFYFWVTSAAWPCHINKLTHGAVTVRTFSMVSSVQHLTSTKIQQLRFAWFLSLQETQTLAFCNARDASLQFSNFSTLAQSKPPNQQHYPPFSSRRPSKNTTVNKLLRNHSITSDFHQKTAIDSISGLVLHYNHV